MSQGLKRDENHATGRSRRGFSTEINVVVNENGLPIRTTPTAGQARHLRAARRGASNPFDPSGMVRQSVDGRIRCSRNLDEHFILQPQAIRRIAAGFELTASMLPVPAGSGGGRVRSDGRR